MQLIEIATSVERLTGSTNKLASFLMPLPLKSLRTNLWKEFEHGSWPLQLGQADSPTVILWFGFAGIIPLRRQFGHQCQILYWDCDHSIPLDRSQCMATLESLAQHPSHAMADRKLPSRLLIGGFSFGANMAHEVTHQIENKGMKVDLTLLLDPAFFPRFRTNAPGRLIRDQCLSFLRYAIPKKHHGTYLDRFTRKSIRQRALTRLRPKNISASMWIQTTEKKRKNSLRLFNHSNPRIQWAHEDTPRHLDLMTDQVLMERWINIIRKWAEAPITRAMSSENMG
jgi:thioesterase domain-containing protein